MTDAGARDRLGVEDLHRRYGSWFRARVIRRYGLQDAEDLVQETWARLASYMAGQEVRHPRALLLQIAGNLFLDRERRRQRQDRYVADMGGMDAWAAPDQAEAVLVREIVLGLPLPLRDVFVLSRFGGLTHSQIASQLGISPKTVEWRMTRALAHCAAQLRR